MGNCREVAAGNTNLVSFAVGVGTLALILVLKRVPRVPGILVAVSAATVAVAVFGLATSAGVAVLGPLPQGLPTPGLPIINVEMSCQSSWAALRSP